MKAVYLCPARMLRSGKISFEALSSRSIVSAESVQDFAQRFAASHLAGLGAVIVGVDAVYDVVLLGGFLPGRLLLLRSAARPRRNQQQGAYG